ncbi:11291_t:CDS:2 [Funneliformis mosseae]|uniref:11291_t:CDS:1 n=1 Tax=Funneliformis mosseae TaxID=27381 RepID=A0A9N8WAI6_FUNMO|nr:11291_t:CDS:2 [Funneliformis mosseae]
MNGVLAKKIMEESALRWSSEFGCMAYHSAYPLFFSYIGKKHSEKIQYLENRTIDMSQSRHQCYRPSKRPFERSHINRTKST